MTQSTAATADMISANSFANRAKAHRKTVGAADVKVTVRTLDVSVLEMDEGITDFQVRIPAIPVFDDAFAAFTHGTLLSGVAGQVAIEDLRPGEILETHTGAPAKVLWIASSIVHATQDPRPVPLTRVMVDSFGIGRPHVFTTFGPGARILQTPHHLRGSHVGTPLLTRIAEFVDGVNVTEVLPPAPVRLFHVGLERHAVINAGGILMESFHPQLHSVQNLSHSMRDVFMSIFPTKRKFADFGPLAHTRAPEPPDTRIIA